MTIMQKQEQPINPVPQELMKELSATRHSLSIGVPKENPKTEKRLAFTPEAVDMLTEAGLRVVLEKGAGNGVNYSDTVYSESGAEIASRERVFDCDLIFKIAPPTLSEISLMKKKATVCNMLQLPDMSANLIQAMAEKSINAAGYELMSPDGLTFPVRDSISEIEGLASILMASELLCNENDGKGILIGGVSGISPTEVVIIGAGVAGMTAARVALALGATVKIFDNNIHKLRKLQNDLGKPVFTSVFQPNVLVNAFKSADVVIGAMRYINAPVRYVISEELVKTMKKRALIIDLRVNQGGCFETTCFLPHDYPPIFEKFDVLHYCIPNLSSRVARTAAMALSNIFIPIIICMGELDGVSGIAKTDTTFRSGLYMYAGKLVNAYIAKQFNLPVNDIGIYLLANELTS